MGICRHGADKQGKPNKTNPVAGIRRRSDQIFHKLSFPLLLRADAVFCINTFGLILILLATKFNGFNRYGLSAGVLLQEA
jgi:hypothetical protein